MREILSCIGFVLLLLAIGLGIVFGLEAVVTASQMSDHSCGPENIMKIGVKEGVSLYKYQPCGIDEPVYFSSKGTRTKHLHMYGKVMVEENQEVENVE